jgi:hypothetical protein
MTPSSQELESLEIPGRFNLMVVVQNWTTLDASVQTLSFE